MIWRSRAPVVGVAITEGVVITEGMAEVGVDVEARVATDLSNKSKEYQILVFWKEYMKDKLILDGVAGAEELTKS